jgi:hypothetical protein
MFFVLILYVVLSLPVAAQTGKLEGMPGRTLMEAFEQKVNAVLNKARDDAGEPGRGGGRPRQALEQPQCW